MDYLRQILTPHGAVLFILMLISTAAMGRIFAILGDLRAQVTAIEELVPHLRASLSARNFAKAAVAAAGNEGCIGRLMAAILSERTHDPGRMRLIYKINIDSEFRTRLSNLAPLKGLAILALIFGLAGAAAAWYLGSYDANILLKRTLVVGTAGVVISLYTIIFFIMLKRREIELNDTIAAEALKLIDTATRPGEEMVG
jgi:magnesium-transporting ATPase (P-type)